VSSLPSTTRITISSMAYSLARNKKELSFWEEMLEGFIRNQSSFETQKAYLRDLQQFFSWMEKEGMVGLGEITFNRAVEYRDYLKVFGGKVVKGLPSKGSNATVQRKICALSSFFEFVARELLVKTNRSITNPFRRVDRPRVDNSITVAEALVSKELTALMSYVDQLPPTLINLRDRAIIKTLFGVIIRNKAFINIKGRDFYAVGERFRLKFTDKGEKQFDETLHPNTAQAIIDYLEAMKSAGREVMEEDGLFQPMSNRSDADASVDEKREGVNARKHFSVNQITNILRRHCKRAGIGEWVTSHSAKATVTSELVERFGVHFAQRKTRHKKADQVIAYYGQRREREISAFDGLDYIGG
jgi:site-specific recombinase XerD